MHKRVIINSVIILGYILCLNSYSAIAASSSRCLVLDSRIIDSVTNAELSLGQIQKSSSNPLFGEDKSWEFRFDNMHPVVIYDASVNKYRCWYNMFYTMGPIESGVCYAESTDGLRWTKPNLGLVEYQGSTTNNFVLKGPDGIGIFRDDRENDANRLFKLFGREAFYYMDEVEESPMAIGFSLDGLSWSDLQVCPNIHAAGDTGNNAIWDVKYRKYVGITRLFNLPVGSTPYGQCWRQVGRTESVDYESDSWTQAEVVLEGVDWEHQTYAMQIFPYADVYLGFLMIYSPITDRVHCELAWSPDTKIWNRVCAGTPFIANSETVGDYDWGCIFAAKPIFHQDHIRIYYYGDKKQHSVVREGYFNLATLRPDGFACYRPTAGGVPGTVMTELFRCKGGKLFLTSDVETGGYIVVDIINPSGQVVATSSNIGGAVTDFEVTWLGNASLSNFQGQDLKLQFILNDAKIYSFGFDSNVFFGKTVYVDINATGDNTGESWDDAYNYLQDALAEAELGDRIWVAQGTYKPDQGGGISVGDRAATFQLKAGVEIYGGFLGTELILDGRDCQSNITVLSGDLNNDDHSNFTNRLDNSYHVVTGNADETAILDGFTIKSGMSNSGWPNNVGGGILINEGSPLVRNCLITDNWSESGGSGAWFAEGNPEFYNCKFINNSCTWYGGALYARPNSYGRVINCQFIDNSAVNGGGAMCIREADTIVANCIFNDNNCTNNGGGIYFMTAGSPGIFNCTFVGNTAGYGNALAVGHVDVEVKIFNSILWDGGSEVYDPYSSALINNSDVQGGYSGLGNINQDPIFVDSDGLDDIAGTEDDNFLLSFLSPCVDSGSNAKIPAGVFIDVNNSERIVGGIVDMGAYETVAAVCGDENHLIPKGDFNIDCRVDFNDLVVFVEQWLFCTAPECD
jgi:parallel beta-helix repeat protein